MKCIGPVIALLMCFGAARPAAHVIQTPSDGERQLMSFARKAVTQALTFQAGDKAALTQARGMFTDDGWTQFMRDLQGWADQAGAPTFTSSFVASADGRVVDERDGLVHVRIPGTLTHTQRESRTTYRAAADVWVGRSPMMVHRLSQTTCVWASQACR